MQELKDLLNKSFFGNCLKLMPAIPNKTIDLILCDLPQEITNNDWDIIIPFELLWEAYNRIIKDNGIIVLFANQPFTSKLIESNIEIFRYTWVWEKSNATNFLNAKEQPLRAHEDICVFYKKPGIYNPQKSTGHKPVNSYTKKGDGTNYGKTKTGIKGGGSTERYPRTVLKFKSDKQKSKGHATPKPVALLEYFIKTYTHPGMIVLDNAAGGGSTGEACVKTGRYYILMEKKKKHFDLIKSKGL